jgi:hypothetical protein
MAPMMTFQILYSIFSEARLSPYLKNGDNPAQVLSQYHANTMLSEAMIPTLHYLEVCLRNRLDQVLKQYYGPNWLMNPSHHAIIADQDSKKINEIFFKLQRENKREAVHDDIVAQMTFGFWCSFFHRKYDPMIWHRKNTFKTIFTHLPRIHRKRSYIETKILKIKNIRNRIAHHEPVWNRQISILSAHRMCYELIEAMSCDAINMLKMIDRFPEIYDGVHGDPESHF